MKPNYTIQQRQQIKDRLADGSHFDDDLRLFVKVLPNHSIRRELQLVNNFNRLRLHRQMLYLLLTRLTEQDILANRKPTEPETQASAAVDEQAPEQDIIANRKPAEPETQAPAAVDEQKPEQAVRATAAVKKKASRKSSRKSAGKTTETPTSSSASSSTTSE